MFEIDDWEIALVDSEEIDQLREEQIRGQKIDNAVKMFGMNFDVETDGNDELQISQKPNPERMKAMLESEMGAGGDQPNNANKPNKSKTSSPSKESQSKFDGEPKIAKPSDVGGKGSGDPTGSGGKQMLSNKSFKGTKKEWEEFLKLNEGKFPIE